VLLGVLACGTDPDDAGVSSQREAQGRDGKGAPKPGYGDGEEGASPPLPGSTNCSFTQGFWKNHPDAWPLTEMKLGTTSYSKVQLLAILHKAVAGNGLIALCHQLIAARLNLAYGASPAGMEGTFAAADALIGALVVPPVGSGSLPTTDTTALNDALAAFNEGKVGPGHCADGATPKPPTPAPSPTPTPTPPPPTPTPPPQIVE
jgi:hypothetical protein